MPRFSKKSNENLSTCHLDLKCLFRDVIEVIDCSIISGYRDPEEQFSLFKKGRIQEKNRWVVQDRLKVVTYKDGYNKKSKHNESPSMAVDVMPYPIDWNNIERIKLFAEQVQQIAENINIDVVWGGDWKWKDYPHWQLRNLT